VVIQTSAYQTRTSCTHKVQCTIPVHLWADKDFENVYVPGSKRVVSESLKRYTKISLKNVCIKVKNKRYINGSSI